MDLGHPLGQALFDTRLIWQTNSAILVGLVGALGNPCLMHPRDSDET
jgi:hypothetical protein